MKFTSKLAVTAAAGAAVVLMAAPESQADSIAPITPTSVVNNNSKLCLVIENGSTANGARAVQGQCGSGEWQISLDGIRTLAGDPSGSVPGFTDFRIVNAKSGKCLEIADSRKDDGAPAQQWDCRDGLKTQIWQLDGSPGYIVNKNSGKVLEIENSGLKAGARAQQWSKAKTAPGQVWRWTLG